jgi:hypothetical protein
VNPEYLINQMPLWYFHQTVMSGTPKLLMVNEEYGDDKNRWFKLSLSQLLTLLVCFDVILAIDLIFGLRNGRRRSRDAIGVVADWPR